MSAPKWEFCGYQENYDPQTFAVTGHIELWTMILSGHEFNCSTKSVNTWRALGLSPPNPPFPKPALKTLQSIEPRFLP